MKKMIAAFIAVLYLSLLLVLPASAAEFELVADWVGVLSDDEYWELNDLALEISEQYHSDMMLRKGANSPLSRLALSMLLDMEMKRTPFSRNMTSLL